MKLSVSNIAWDNKQIEKYLKVLNQLKCDGIEIAPSAIWKEPTKASQTDIEYIKKLIQKYHLEIPAFHSLLYNRPELSIFTNKQIRNETISYIKKLIKLANKLSVKILIYGSPNSRRIIDKPYKECYQIAVETFKKLAKECNIYDMCLCIEPLPSSKNNFILTSKEGYLLVKEVNNKGFGLNLDTGAMSISKEDFSTVFQKCKTVLKHIHINDPNLMPPGTTNINHSIIAKPLIASGYKGFISIETKKTNLKTIKKAIKYVQRKYL